MGKGHVMLYLAGVVSLSGIKLNGLPLQLDSYIYIMFLWASYMEPSKTPNSNPESLAHVLQSDWKRCGCATLQETYWSLQ